VGRVAFKKGATPLDGSHAFALPLMHCTLPPSEPPDGERPCCFCLAVVGGAQLRGSWYFQPSLGFKDFHQAARLHPLTDGHPRR
jgi:hypothetical protein